MAKYSNITGLDQVERNLKRITDKILLRVVNVVEITANDVANHAKANHTRNEAHSEGRFESQTGTLTRSIATQLTQVSKKEVTALVYTNLVYAPFVEFGTFKTKAYPFMQPALIANQTTFQKRLTQVLISGV